MEFICIEHILQIKRNKWLKEKPRKRIGGNRKRKTRSGTSEGRGMMIWVQDRSSKAGPDLRVHPRLPRKSSTHVRSSALQAAPTEGLPASLYHSHFSACHCIARTGAVTVPQM